MDISDEQKRNFCIEFLDRLPPEVREEIKWKGIEKDKVFQEKINEYLPTKWLVDELTKPTLYEMMHGKIQVCKVTTWDRMRWAIREKIVSFLQWLITKVE